MTGAGEDGYLYDANGNMTSHIAGGATHGPSVLGARTQTAGSFFPDVLMAGFTVPEGENRVLLVAVSHEEGTIGSVTFGGQPLSQVGALVNDETGVALFELREAQLGPGAQTADLEVDFLGFSDTEVTAFTVTGVDQAAAPTIAQAAQPVAASSISADITTGADTAILVSAVGLDSPAIWSPGAGETQIGYAETGAFAGGASYEVVAAGSHDMSWSGSIAQTPTLLVAAYPAAETGGGSSIERTIAWSSFNKPTLITEVSSGNEAGFTYGPDRARIRQHVVEGGAARDVVYAGSLYERRTQLGSPDELVHYVVAGGTVAIHTVFDDNLPATNRTRYLHRDHLGSIETITGETGAVVQRLSFDAHGQRRLADWTAGDPAAPDAETPRGFTGHEHLDSVGLIHMNGRVYDPVLGRFLSADPIVPNPTATQSFNRYSYVGNNPLSYTDPTGLVPDAGEMGPHGQSDNDGRASTGSAFGQNPDNRFESPDTFGQQTTVPGGDIPGETDCNCYGGFGSQGIFAAERDALEQGKRTEESIQADVEKSREYEGHSGRNGRDYAHGVQVASGDLFSSEDIYDGSRLNGRRGGVYSAPTLQLVDFDVRDRPGENELDENAAYWAAGVIGGVVALAVSLEVAVALGLIESSEIVGLAAILAARKVARKYAARILGKALEAAGFRRPADHAAHHIVAFNATLASPARAILQRFGIGINAAENGVFLHQTLHNGMHTIRYYTAVNNALRAAARSGRREDVVQALDRIRQGLINGTFP